MNLMSRFQLDPTVNLQQVVEHCPAHMSGADLYALCSDAMMVAIKRKMVFVEGGENTAKTFGVSWCQTCSVVFVNQIQVRMVKTRRSFCVLKISRQLWSPFSLLSLTRNF